MLRGWLFAIALLALSPSLARPSTINLRWNDCPAGPTASQLLSFSCDDDTSTFRLVGTVIPDAQITDLASFSASVDLLESGGGPLPDWWRMQPDDCRGSSIKMSPRVTEVGTCPNLWPLSTISLFDYAYPGAPGVARMRMAIGLLAPLHPVAGTEYYAFEILIDARHTTSADSPTCSGCDGSVCISFWEAELQMQTGATQLVRTATAGVSWRCQTTADVDTCTATPHCLLYGGIYSCTAGQCPTPSLRPTWGRLKALYR